MTSDSDLKKIVEISPQIFYMISRYGKRTSIELCAVCLI